MAANGRFGGHIVQGHVDTSAVMIARTSEENAVVFLFEPYNKQMFKYIIPGGSITIDGISLTVVDVTEQTLRVSIIPHTLSQTVLQDKKPGDTVNLECDVLGKYMEKLLGFQLRSDHGEIAGNKRSPMTAAYLAEHGFM
jgi:riboflavin synthase